MPVYEYRCNICGKTFEELLKTNEKYARCPYCKGIGVKIPSRNSFILKGTGWSKDGYWKKEEK